MRATLGLLPPALARLDQEARARSPWYRDGGFRNFDDPDGEVPRGAAGLARLLRWKLGPRMPALVEGAPDRPIPVRPLSPDEVAAWPARGLRVAWLGHASFLVGAAGLRLLVDPIFGALPFVRRLASPPLSAALLPRVDAVLLTHNHFDHCDLGALAAALRADPDTRAIAPPGMEGLLRAAGVREVRTLDWWEGLPLSRDVRVTALPARHWSKRGIGDDLQSHWCGYAIEAEGRRLWIAGDTAWGGHFQAIKDRAGPRGFDAAAVPIGAYAPRWIMRRVHVEPREAAEAARVVGARTFLPCHYGTFRLGDDALGEPPILLERALENDRDVRARPWRPGDVHEV